MMEKRKVYVMGAKEVNFTNNDGEIIKGLNVHYFEHDKPASEIGHVPAKAFLRDDKGDDVLKNGVGIYEVLIGVDLSGNRPRVTVEGFKFISKALMTVKTA